MHAIAPARRPFISQLAMASWLMLSAISCKSSAPPADVCGALRAARFSPQFEGTGVVSVEVDGAQRVFSELWVSPLGDGSVSVNACDRRADSSWGLLTNWVLTGHNDFPVELEDVNIRAGDADTAFLGYLQICERSECSARDIALAFDSWDGPGGGFNRQGSVLEYSHGLGKFRGQVAFDTTEGKHIEVDVDVAWDATSDAGATH